MEAIDPILERVITRDFSSGCAAAAEVIDSVFQTWEEVSVADEMHLNQ